MFLRPVLSAAALVAWFSAAGADPSPPKPTSRLVLEAMKAKATSATRT